MNSKNTIILIIILVLSVNLKAQNTIGHNDNISGVVFCPDGKIITSSWDYSLKLWNANGDAEIRTFRGHTDQVTCVAISSDGKTFVSGGGDEKIFIWDINSETPKKTLEGHFGGVTCIAFSPDGNFVASGSWDTQVILWDLKNKKDTVICSFRNEVNSIAFSADGKYIVSADKAKIIIWDIEKKEVRGKDIMLRNTQTVVFSPNSQFIAAAGKDKKITIYNTKTHKEITTLETNGKTKGQNGTINSLAYSANGEYIVAAGVDNRIGSDTTTILWDVASKKPNDWKPKSVFKENMEVECVAFSEDGKKIATGGFKTLKIWDVETATLGTNFESNTEEIKCIAINPVNEDIIASAGINTITIFDKTKNKKIESDSNLAVIYYDIVFSSDGKYLVSGDDDIDSYVKLWSVNDTSIVIEKYFLRHQDKVYSVDISADDNYIISGSADKTIKLWKINGTTNNAGKITESKVFRGHEKAVKSVAFNPKGDLIVSGSEDATIKVWKIKDGKVLHKFDNTNGGHISSVECVVFSNKGKYIASGSSDKTIKLWDVKNGKLIKTFEGHTSGIQSVAFSDDDKHIVSASLDQTIKTWDVETGICKATYKKHTGNIYSVVFNKKNEIISASADGSIKNLSSDTNTLTTYTYIKNGKNGNQILIDTENLNTAPKLSSNIKFVDKSGNQILSINETAEIRVNIKNTGPVTAKELTATINCNNTNITIVKKEKKRKNIESGTPQQIVFEIKANDKLDGNSIKIEIIFSGTNAPANGYIDINTQEAGKPELVLVETKFEEQISDNTNKIIENKEQILTTITIKNTGKGIAKNIEYEISLNDNNITANFTDINPLKGKLRNIKANETAKVEFYFTVGCGFKDTLLPIKIKLIEEQGKFGGTFNVELKFTPLDPCIDSPVLDAEIVSGNKNNTINAEEEVKIEISITNKGTETAYSIDTEISCDNNTDIEIPNANKIISKLESGETKSVYFDIIAKKNIKDGTAKLNFSFFETNGFQPKPKTLEITTRKKAIPILEYVKTTIKETKAVIKNDSIENGEDIQATIVIKNTGKGNAENVEYEILINDPLIETFGFPLKGKIDIKAGESIKINFAFNVGYEYRNEYLPFEIKIKEKKHHLELEMNLINQNVDNNIPRGTKTNRNVYALIIGNENYDGEVNDVPYAKNDAEIFQQYLEKTLLIPTGQIIIKTNATKNNITSKIRDFKDLQKTKPNAKFIFYYAGHGAVDSNSIAYLIPTDIEDLSLKDNAIPLSNIYSELTGNKATRVTFFIDACFSGAVPKKGERVLVGRYVQTTPIKGNSVVFAATSPTETAKPLDEQKHGVFTYCLLRILQNTKGDITYKKLAETLKKDVIDLENSQHPTTTPSPEIKDEWENWKLK